MAIANTAIDPATRAATPASSAHVTYEESLMLEGPGSCIGPYRLVELLGEGGFGRVFLAEQSEPVRRQVALKIIKLGMDTRQFIARFESERLALGLMDHPGIARVLDAGATEQGRPYMVMELVRGEPLTHYCDRLRLTVRERLELFVHVCQALQHAHQKGIIHRDLKPRNILASGVDGRHVVKVIDFGIARAVDPGGSDHRLTDVRQIIGTPQYMSPEQAGAKPDIDTRSDIYSLGIILFEMLTGMLPSGALSEDETHAVAGVGALLDAPRPSLRFVQRADSAAQRVIADCRRSDPQSLSRIIRGDLDWIVMKALEHDRTRRYETANGLAADVRRHLNNEPVIAGPPSRRYRIGKLIRRHRAAFAATSMMLAAIVLGLVLALHGLVQARAARAEMAVQRDRAKVEADKASQTAKFAQKILSGIEPYTARGEDTRLLRKILDESAGRLDAELSTQPEVQASLHYTIGTAYARIAQYEPAGKHLRAAEALQLRTLGPDSRDTILTRSELANLLFNQGEHAKSEAAYRSLIEHATRLFGPEDAEVIRARRELGIAVFRQGRYSEAETISREALRLASLRASEDDAVVISCTSNLAIVLGYQSKYDESEALSRSVLARQQRLKGPDHPACFATQANLAYLLQMKGDMVEAEQAYRDLVERVTRSNGPKHPETLKTLNNLAGLLSRIGRHEEAVALHRETLAKRLEALGPDHPETIFSVANLGDALYSKGETVEAMQLLRQALADRERTLGPDHGDTMNSVAKLAHVHNSEREFPKAATLFERLARNSRKRGDSADKLAQNLYNCAACLQNGGDEAAAERVYREVLEAAQSIKNEAEHPFLAAAYNGLAKSLCARGATAEADQHFRKGLDLRRARYGDRHEQTAYSQIDYAEMLVDTGRYADAREVLTPLMEFLTESKQTASLRYAAALGLLGECDRADRAFEAAEVSLRQSRELFAGHKQHRGWTDADKDHGSIRRLIRLYEAWAAAAPDGKHDRQAVKWRGRLTAASRPAKADATEPGDAAAPQER